MELIVGGAYQGKEEYARQRFPEISWADGETCGEEELFSCQGILNFQRYLERRMKEGEPLDQLAERMYEKNPDMVIVADEIGGGIVPRGPFSEKIPGAGRKGLYKAGGEVGTGATGSFCGVGMVIKG